jgi:MscS family membrane protein
MEIEIHLYVLTGATLTFYEIREQLLLEITEIVEASGSGFAGPTEFVYLDAPGEDAGKNDAAEARATRQRNPSTE